MNSKLQLLVTAVLLAVPMSLSAQHRDHHNHESHNHDTHHGDLPAGTSQQDRQVLTGETVYTCSMHPQVRSTNPNDRCPICGMALVPVEDNHSEHEGADRETLRLSPRALALAGVVTEPAQRRTLTAELSLPGRIEVDETRRHTLAARIGGRLDSLHVSYVGAGIARNDVVAEIYSPELLASQEELLQASRLGARDSLLAAREKLRLLGLSREDIAGIESAGEVREHLPVRASADGVVLERLVSRGDYVQTGQPLYALADLSRVWALLDAYETDLPHLQVGQHAHLQLSAMPGETFHGDIVFVDPVVDGQRRTARVRVELNNDKGRLKPGMLVNGRLSIAGESQLAIPASAPLLTGERALVYVREPGDDAHFSMREVTLGPRAGDYYPVLDGLQEGEQVVSQGAFRLDSERQIRGLTSMMAPEGNGAPAHDHGPGEHDDHDGHGEHNEHGNNSDHSDHNHADAADYPPAEQLAELFEYYDQAQQALADDRLDDWRRATEQLQSRARALDWPDSLSEQAEALQAGAGHLSHVDTLPAAGEYFYHHAQAAIALAKLGLAPGTWHIAYCPMAEVAGQSGAEWLQSENLLSNPYFGHAMLRCGEMREQLEGRYHE